MKIKRFSDLIPELIIWEDITTMQEAWNDPGEIVQWLNDMGDGVCEQLGFIIAEDDKYIVVADSYIEASNLYGAINKIPKSTVLKRVKLKPHDDKIEI